MKRRILFIVLAAALVAALASPLFAGKRKHPSKLKYPPIEITSPEVIDVSLSNGMEGFLIEDHEIPVVDIVILEHDTVDQIDRQHFTGPKASFRKHILFVVLVHTDFRRDREVPIPGNNKTCRTQTVSVEAAGRVSAVRQYDASRPVPGLHLAVIKFVKSTHIRVDIVNALPGWRQQDTHGL